jgi:iron complex outermembrane receptor protein
LPVWYTEQFQNANSTQVEGIEVGTRYRFHLGDFGTLKTDFDWTHVMSYAVTENGVRYQLNDTHGPSAVSNDTGNPQDKIDMTFSWDKGPLDITTNFDFIGRYSILDPSAGQTTCAEAAQSWYLGATPPSNYCHVASFLNTNLTARYQLTKQWNISGAIGNVFNRQPPVDLETYGNNGVATNMTLYTAGAYGRSFHLGTNYTF